MRPVRKVWTNFKVTSARFGISARVLMVLPGRVAVAGVGGALPSRRDRDLTPTLRRSTNTRSGGKWSRLDRPGRVDARPPARQFVIHGDGRELWEVAGDEKADKTLEFDVDVGRADRHTDGRDDRRRGGLRLGPLELEPTLHPAKAE